MTREALKVDPHEVPLTLKQACEEFGGTFTPWTLRAEAGRGRLDIFRLGRRDYTTHQAMREMVRKCQEDGRRRVSTSTRDESSGLSETDRASSAQAALRQTLGKLKSNSQSISGGNTNRRAGQTR
jgi:hypothetical protein